MKDRIKMVKEQNQIKVIFEKKAKVKVCFLKNEYNKVIAKENHILVFNQFVFLY